VVVCGGCGTVVVCGGCGTVMVCGGCGTVVVCGGRWRVHVCGYRGHMVEGMCDVHVGGVRKCMGDTWKCVCGGMSGIWILCRR